MPRFPRTKFFCGFSSTLLALIVVIWWVRRLPWQRMPGGGEFCIYKVQYGTLASASRTPLRYQLFSPVTPFVQDFAPRITRRIWAEMEGPRGVEKSYRTDGALTIWLLMRGDFRPRYTRSWIIFPDGQEFRSWCMEGDGNGEITLYSIDHYFVPRSVPRLKLRLETEDGTNQMEFEVDNAAFMKHIPHWDAAPLPQAKQLGNVELTLHSVTARHVPMPAPNDSTWVADANHTVRMLNGEQSAWYDFWTTFCDPEGHKSSGIPVFSQPVWMVRVSITPHANHPSPQTAANGVIEFFVKPPPPPRQSN